MLRQTKCFRAYPNKSILEDLITRDGPATEYSFSPFSGKAEFVAKQFAGTQQGKFKKNEFLEYTLKAYKDLNPSMVKEVKQTGILQEVSAEAGIFKTLEDLIDTDGVENPKVEEYVRSMCVGYKKNSKSPVVDGYEWQTRVIHNFDGDGEAEEEKLLVVRKDETISNDEFDDIIRKLPYIMKSIWSYSKQYKANLFSFIFAYMDIKAKNRKRSYVSISDFMNYPTFLLRSDGTYQRDFSHEADNKYVIYPNVTKIFIIPSEHKAEFSLCLKFMDALNLLGIDYRDENPREYDNDFINSIVCSYLQDNDTYFNEYKDVDIEIMVALQPENIFSAAKSSMYTKNFTDKSTFDYSKSAFFITDRIKIAYRAGEINDSFLDEDENKTLGLLDEILTIMSGSRCEAPRQLITFESNGLMYFKKEVFSLEGKFFGTYNGEKDYRVALTKYNFVVILEEEYNDVYYIPIEDCYEALEEFRNYGEVQSEVHWRRLGVEY